MNKGLAFALGLVFGLGSGTAISYMVLKQQFDQKADEEIAACRQAFVDENVKLRKELDQKKSEEKKTAAKEAIKTYSPEPEKAEAMLNKPASVEPKKQEVKKIKRPYVIEPDVFDSADNPYKTVGFSYYTDGAILDEDHNPLSMEELDHYVGREALTHFGEFEENRVCVRNEELGIDFEICMQGITYAEALKTRPWVQR